MPFSSSPYVSHTPQNIPPHFDHISTLFSHTHRFCSAIKVRQVSHSHKTKLYTLIFMFIDSNMSHAYSILNSSFSPTSGSTCQIIYLCMSSEVPTAVTMKISVSQKVMSCRTGKNINIFHRNLKHSSSLMMKAASYHEMVIYICTRPYDMTSRPMKTVTLTFIYILFKSYTKMSSIGYLVFFTSQIFMSGSQRRIVVLLLPALLALQLVYCYAENRL